MINFPIFRTKNPKVTNRFDLNDPNKRQEYFKAKAANQIQWLKNYLDENRFVAFLLAKKAAGKGTYSKMLSEILGSERVVHISFGDTVRAAHKILGQTDKAGDKKELMLYLAGHYRGYLTLKEAIDALLGRSQDRLLPTEFLLTLVKKELENIGPGAVLIDGFPRSLDQINYALYFREIMGLGICPDMFILIDIPESVINERLKARVVCPICQTSRNTKLLPTKFVEFDASSQEFVLKCDNRECTGFSKQILVAKEGDDLGIESIRNRLNLDSELIQKADSLFGIPKIYLRNSVPVSKAGELVDNYEITPEYTFELESETNQVQVKEQPWIIKDDQGIDSYSLLAPPAVLSLLDQLYQLLSSIE